MLINIIGKIQIFLGLDLKIVSGTIILGNKLDYYYHDYLG